MPRNRFSSKTHSSQKDRPHNLGWLWMGVVILAMVIAGFWIFRPKAAAPTNKPSAASREISAAEAYQKYQQGVFILDVRTQDEWNEFHIKGSTLIPLDELPDRLGELPKDREIVVVCRSGHRSLSAVGVLQEAGFTQLVSLGGGLQAWTEANYPVER